MRLLPSRSLVLVALSLAMLAAGAAAQPRRSTLVAAIGGSRIALPDGPLPARVGAEDPRLARAIGWRPLRPGLELATIDLRAGAPGVAVQAIVLRMEPARFRFGLRHAVEQNGMTGTWTLDSAGAGDVLAMNAGQFKETGPWGWLVVDGEERRRPGRAPLAVGIRIDTAGRPHWLAPGDELKPRRDADTHHAFQSFPLLFHDRRVPPLLRDRRVTDHAHRDTRLVLAEGDDGRIMVILTRYAALGPLAERVPIGLTTPETVRLAAALGARHALMLDGGGSAQVLVRDAGGRETQWRGFRRVPLGLVATARDNH